MTCVLVAKIKKSFFECVGLIESEVRAEAKVVSDWSQGKNRADVTASMAGEDDSLISAIANTTKERIRLHLTEDVKHVKHI